MKTLLVSALLLVACKNEKATPAEATKPVESGTESKAEPTKAEPSNAEPTNADSANEVGADGLTESERRKMAAADEITGAEELAKAKEDSESVKSPGAEAAATALAELGAGEDLGMIIDPTSTFGFADHTVTPPAVKEYCGLSSGKESLAVRSKIEGFRARIAKAATDGFINCMEAETTRIECELTDKGTPNLTFAYAYEMDSARLVGFGIDTLDRVKNMGAKIELSKSLRARGGKACSDAH